MDVQFDQSRFLPTDKLHVPHELRVYRDIVVQGDTFSKLLGSRSTTLLDAMRDKKPSKVIWNRIGMKVDPS